MNNMFVESFTDDQIEELIELMADKYGYDFSDYSSASLRRRLNRIYLNFEMSSYDEFKFNILDNDVFFNRVLEEITVNVTEMFRDPLFYKMVREEVIPELASYPVIRIWHAGCSTGEEVYSMAILLKEAGLLERSIIYATDINRQVLDQAKSGIFNLSKIREYSINYNNAGGLEDFSSYYTARYGKAIFNDELNARMVFSPHNLAQDQSFNEFNLIVCRNVLIYFNQSLQNKVIDLFLNSLSSFGILTLGSKEDIQFKTSADHFEVINKKQRAWRKKK